MTGKLRENSVGLKESMFQGVAGSAPAGAAIATLTGAAAFAQGSLPLVALLAFFVVMINAVIIRKISANVAGAGGYYSYVKAGYGVKPALLTGFFYIFYQIMALCLIALSVAVFVPPLLGTVFGIGLPSYAWFPLLVTTLMFGFLVSVSGIRGSTRYTMIMAVVEIVIISVFGLYIVLSHPAINTASVFTTRYSLNGFSGIGIGVLLMYTAFSGFGASTPLGEESVSPKKNIGLSVVFTVIILGIFFVFTSYYFTVAWGPSLMGKYADELIPGVTIINGFIGKAAAILVTILFINSLLTGTVVVTNGTSRVMMAMSRDKMIPSGLSRIHSKRSTPWMSALTVVSSAIIIGSISVIFLGGFNAFIFSATAATLGVLFVHSIINASLPPLDRKFRGKFSYANIVISVISIIIFGFIFYSTFISISLPVIAGTVIFMAWLAVSTAYILSGNKKFENVVVDV
ncbi:MAG: APC family permease [Thermoplasmataceae archaeon]